MNLHPDQIGLREEALEAIRRTGEMVEKRNREGKRNTQRQIVGVERGLMEQDQGFVRCAPVEFDEQTIHDLAAPGMNPEQGLDRDELGEA